MALRLLTAGESHGPQLTAIVEGLPAGIPVNLQNINHLLTARRSSFGAGRSARMRKERDELHLVSGLKAGRTLGSPVTLMIANHAAVGSFGGRALAPRPGHADFAGFLKFDHADLGPVLETASARSTAIWTAAGGLAREICLQAGFSGVGYVRSILNCAADFDAPAGPGAMRPFQKRVGRSAVRCPSKSATTAMLRAIEKARVGGTTLGGTVEVCLAGIPPGLGSYTQWDRRLDGLLAQALMSIPSVKAVEIGLGSAGAQKTGTVAHDFFCFKNGTILRPQNHAGGLEGGVTNGQPLVLRAHVKPVPTQPAGLPSVHLKNRRAQSAVVIRSDTCVVPAISVVAEAAVWWVLADAFLNKFGGDAWADTLANYGHYKKRIRRWWKP